MLRVVAQHYFELYIRLNRVGVTSSALHCFTAILMSNGYVNETQQLLNQLVMLPAGSRACVMKGGIDELPTYHSWHSCGTTNNYVRNAKCEQAPQRGYFLLQMNAEGQSS